jgi:hypothetical protein
MIRLFALPTVLLVATIGYGAMLLGSDVPYAHTAPREAAPIAWIPDTGSFLRATGVRCLLRPDHDCHAVLFDGPPTAAEHRPSQAPALVLQDGPALPGVNPYSGTFVTFPLR